MTYAPQSDDMKVPPPYHPQGHVNNGMQYQQQQYYAGPQMNQQAQYAPAPPPLPVYAQPPVLVQPGMGFLGHSPQSTNCPSCRQQVVTMVRHDIGGGTWLIALLIFIFGGFLGCCLIPFCVDSCQDAVHTCPACNAPLGRKSIF